MAAQTALSSYPMSTQCSHTCACVCMCVTGQTALSPYPIHTYPVHSYMYVSQCVAGQTAPPTPYPHMYTIPRAPMQDGLSTPYPIHSILVCTGIIHVSVYGAGQTALYPTVTKSVQTSERYRRSPRNF